MFWIFDAETVFDTVALLEWARLALASLKDALEERKLIEKAKSVLGGALEVHRNVR